MPASLSARSTSLYMFCFPHRYTISRLVKGRIYFVTNRSPNRSWTFRSYSIKPEGGTLSCEILTYTLARGCLECAMKLSSSGITRSPTVVTLKKKMKLRPSRQRE